MSAGDALNNIVLKSVGSYVVGLRPTRDNPPPPGWGRTSKVQGAIRLADPERLTEAEACIQVDAASLDTDNSTRDDIMRKDHLETARFPTIDFVLKNVEGITRQAGGWELGAGGSLSLVPVLHGRGSRRGEVRRHRHPRAMTNTVPPHLTSPLWGEESGDG